MYLLNTKAVNYYGRKVLRDAAKELNVEVHGTIWLVEQMLQGKKITVEVARVTFQRMRDFGSRLPWGKVEKIIYGYCKST